MSLLMAMQYVSNQVFYSLVYRNVLYFIFMKIQTYVAILLSYLFIAS